MIHVVDGGLDDPRVVALLEYHSAICFEVTPVGSTHVFELSQLKDPVVPDLVRDPSSYPNHRPKNSVGPAKAGT